MLGLKHNNNNDNKEINLNNYRMRLIRHKRTRKKVVGTKDRPRLSVFRSLNHIYAQIINDDNGITLLQANSLELKATKTQTKKKKRRQRGLRVKSGSFEKIHRNRRRHPSSLALAAPRAATRALPVLLAPRSATIRFLFFFAVSRPTPAEANPGNSHQSNGIQKRLSI